MIRAALFALVASLLAVSPSRAQPADFNPLTTAATSVAIMDHETGLLLYGKDADIPMPPASMSKLMTLLVVFEQLEAGALTLDTEFPVSEDAWRRGGLPSGSSAMCLIPGSRATVEELIRGVIVLSGNDASIVLADGISGSEAAFAQLLNERAQELGFEGAQFANATGWPDPQQLISARSLAEISRILVRDFPELYEIFAERTFDYCEAAPSNRFNRNPLLGAFEGADGLKTGHTQASGYGLAASAVRDDVRRIVVFNGMETRRGRAQEAERLMRSAFADFRVETLFEAGEEVGDVPVFLAEPSSVPVIVNAPVVVGYHRRAARHADVRLRYTGPLSPPIRQGDVVGELVVTIPGADPQIHPVTAASDAAPLGWRERAVAALVHLVRTTGTTDADG